MTSKFFSFFSFLNPTTDQRSQLWASLTFPCACQTTLWRILLYLVEIVINHSMNCTFVLFQANISQSLTFTHFFFLPWQMFIIYLKLSDQSQFFTGFYFSDSIFTQIFTAIQPLTFTSDVRYKICMLVFISVYHTVWCNFNKSNYINFLIFRI